MAADVSALRAPEAPAAAPSGSTMLAGLDALETPLVAAVPAWRRLWSATWPKLLALAIAIGAWQLVVLSGHWSRFILPGPREVFERLFEDVQTATLWKAIGVTMQRGLWGFFLSVVIGVALGLGVAQFKALRAAFGSFITGLQTMPSIAWFPLAIVLFKLSEGAITFVVVLGAAPSVANGLIHGIDHIPPLYLRVGRTVGARRFAKYRHVVIPAAMPGFVAGLKQGWAFAWRSLLAGELIVTIASKQSLGFLLNQNRELSDYVGLLSMMIVILIIGIVLDSVAFAYVEKVVRRRRGLAAR